MPEYKVSLTLISLFTSKDRALEIQGDLLEESREHGRLWFYTHVLSTTFAMYLHAFMKAPLKFMLLGVVFGEALFLLFWLGPYILNRPYHELPVFMQWLSFRAELFYFVFMPLFSCLFGVTLVGLVRETGMQTLVTSLLVFLILISALFISGVLGTPANIVLNLATLGFALLGIAYLVGLVILPMLAGGVQVFRMRQSQLLKKQQSRLI